MISPPLFSEMKHLLLTTIVAVVLVGCGIQTPLSKASSNGETKLVQSYLANGSDVNERNFNGTTALHMAIHNRHTNIVKLLVASGADINVKCKNGFTTLHAAIGNYSQKVFVELLLANGAYVNTPVLYGEHKGKTVVDIAMQRNDEITDLLRKYGGKTGEELKAEGK